MDNTDAFTFIEDGEAYAALCIDLTVYWRGSMFERAPGILHFYRRSLEEIGSALKFFETGTMAGAKPLRKDTVDMVPTWLKAKPRRDIYMINLEAGAHKNEPSDRNFFLIADEDDDEPIGAMRLGLPLSVVDDPDAYVELVRDLVSKLDVESGHAGYGLNWDSRGEMAGEASQQMGAIAGRYQGVDLFDLDVTLVSMRKTKPAGIKTVGWLTLLGSQLSNQVGGAAALTKKLGKSCTVYPLPNGVLIRAGERPTLGDRNRKADVAAYRSVGKLLASFRFVDHRALFGATTATGESTERWLARFDE
jgi:hypothetical protein